MVHVAFGGFSASKWEYLETSTYIPTFFLLLSSCSWARKGRKREKGTFLTFFFLFFVLIAFWDCLFFFFFRAAPAFTSVVFSFFFFFVLGPKVVSIVDRIFFFFLCLSSEGWGLVWAVEVKKKKTHTHKRKKKKKSVRGGVFLSGIAVVASFPWTQRFNSFHFLPFYSSVCLASTSSLFLVIAASHREKKRLLFQLFFFSHLCGLFSCFFFIFFYSCLLRVLVEYSFNIITGKASERGVRRS